MSDSHAFRWYVVQARAGFEKIVAKALQDRIARSPIAEQFNQVIVPSEETLEMKNGQKRKVEKKFFPGYVLIEMATTNESGIPRVTSEAWHLVKSTDKVLGFIGGTHERPLPITDTEAAKILGLVSDAEASKKKPTAKALFDAGQSVRIVDGPFADFQGVVKEVDVGRLTVKVDVLIFGRATPVDFTYDQVVAA